MRFLRARRNVLPVVSVAVPIPFLDALTYNVPEPLPLPPIGARVLVHVGSRTVTGCVVDHPTATGSVSPNEDDGTATDRAGTDGLKDVLEVLDQHAFIPTPIVALCRWVSEYYLCGIGDALAAAMPPGARGAQASIGFQVAARGGNHRTRLLVISSPIRRLTCRALEF